MNSYLGTNSYLGPNSYTGLNPYHRRVVTAPPVTTPPVTTPSVTTPPVTTPPVTTPPVTQPADPMMHELSSTLDPLILSMFGDRIVNKDGKSYWTGNVDPTTFSVGAGNRTTRDIGSGKYEILGTDGKSLATGYYDPRRAISEIAIAKALGGIKEIKPQVPYSGTIARYLARNKITPASEWTVDGLYDYPDPESPNTGVPTTYKSRAEAEQAVRDYYKNGIVPDYGGALGDWEALGQLLTNSRFGVKGATGGIFNAAKMYYPPQKSYGMAPGNGLTESITGANTLYGSKPIFQGDKFLGYAMDLGPGFSNEFHADHNDVINTPTGIYRSHNGGKSAWYNNTWRDINKEGWKDLGASRLNDDTLFIPGTTDFSKIPGWVNHDDTKYQEKAGTGILGGAGGLLGGLLSFTPLAPLGIALSVADSLDRGNPIGAIASLVGGGGAVNGLAQEVSSLTGLPSVLSQGLVRGGLGGLSSVVSGGDFAPGFLGGATGSLAGSASDALLGAAGASSGVQSLVRPVVSSVAGSAATGATSNQRRTAGVNAALNSLTGGLGQILRNSLSNSAA